MRISRYIFASRSGIGRRRRLTAAAPLCVVIAGILLQMLFTLSSCQIEPPLYLANNNPIAYFNMGEVITDVKVVWNIDADWESQWWYGWDDEDISMWGKIEYPQPTSFEGRFFYHGEQGISDTWLSLDRQTIYETPFRRQFDFGYHNILLWSNIDSPDGTQALVINEDDPHNVHATTTKSRLPYAAPSRAPIHNNPEIFYSGWKENIYISRDTLDYDYYDAQRNAWVKLIPANLYPLVYIYLVQVVVYNNRGRIIDINDNASVTNMSDGVHVRTGHTHDTPVTVAFPMRLKRGLTARDGQPADIFGGKLTTFGLCDIESWARSRATMYAGSRVDLDNNVMLSMAFANETDSAYAYNVTDQIQRQVHGGIITIEIDADTLTMPSGEGSKGGGQFDAWVAPLDSIEHEFTI